MDSETDSHFCYFYIKQPIQAMICLVYLLIGIVLLVIAVNQYRISVIRECINSNIKLTYVCLFLSLLLFLSKIILSELVFNYKYNSDNLSQELYLASKYQQILQSFSVFTLQTAILLVPSNWIQNVIIIFRLIAKNKGNDLSNKQRYDIRKSLQTEQFTLKILVFYQIFRLLCFTLELVFMLAISNHYLMATLARISLIWMQIESFSLLLILVVGAVSIKKNKTLQEYMDSQDYKLMFKNYILLICFTTLRFATDLSYTLFHFEQISEYSSCRINKDEINIERIVDILLEGFVTFYLMIAVILRIYKVQDNSQQDDLQTIFTDRKTQSQSFSSQNDQ